MRHISNKNDWLYEFRPYLTIGIGVVGFMSRSAFGSSQLMNLLGFICSLILIGIGASIISIRKEYRKSSQMK